ncbi:hypothetical protein COCON_G00236310 [Conger conger]|uniref:Ig-like domain-containing protein n=1 Tax=Conger conger TaxID=82655 RepID=A0A9Q1CTP8_CONCO|nr:hypothetical protein COCON_G00236310 [Conger conger]
MCRRAYACLIYRFIYLKAMKFTDTDSSHKGNEWKTIPNPSLFPPKMLRKPEGSQTFQKTSDEKQNASPRVLFWSECSTTGTSLGEVGGSVTFTTTVSPTGPELVTITWSFNNGSVPVSVITFLPTGTRPGPEYMGRAE